MCIDAGEYAEVDLDVGKVYQARLTEKSARDQGLIRIIDNSGEDYGSVRGCEAPAGGKTSGLAVTPSETEKAIPLGGMAFI